MQYARRSSPTPQPKRLTVKEKEKEKIRQKTRRCLIREGPTCRQFDRPINCAEDAVVYPSGAKRCPAFKEADIDVVASFLAKDSTNYSLAWNRDKRKYIIYHDNAIMMEFGMRGLDWALRIFWELKKNVAYPETKK